MVWGPVRGAAGSRGGVAGRTGGGVGWGGGAAVLQEGERTKHL